MKDNDGVYILRRCLARANIRRFFCVPILVSSVIFGLSTASAQITIPYRDTLFHDWIIERIESPLLPNTVIQTYSVPTRIIRCNWLQLYDAQSDHWVHALTDLGASEASANQFKRRFKSHVDRYCDQNIESDKVLTDAVSSANTAAIQTVVSEISDTVGGDEELGWLVLRDALRGIKQLHDRCFEMGQVGRLLLSRLPKTPSTGWSSPFFNSNVQTSVSAEALIGRRGCGSLPPLGGGRSSVGEPQGSPFKDTKACMAVFRPTTECDHPAALDESQLNTIVAECVGASNCDYDFQELPNGSSRETFTETGDGSSPTSISGSVLRDSNGNIAHWKISISMVGDDGGSINFINLQTPPPSTTDRAIDVLTTSPDEMLEFLGHATDALRQIGDFWEQMGRSSQTPLTPNMRRAEDSLIKLIGRRGGSGSGGSRQCLPFSNPDISPVIGLRRNAPSVTNSYSGVLGKSDIIGYCFCNGGPVAKQIAGALGMVCIPEEGSWSEYIRRMDCLNNPYGGPTGGIRPECIRYLEEDNTPQVVANAAQQICDYHIRCGDGYAPRASNLGDSWICNCRGNRSEQSWGGSAPPPMCLTVDCMGPDGNNSGVGEQCCSTGVAMPVKALSLPNLLNPLTGSGIIESFIHLHDLLNIPLPPEPPN